MAPKSSCGGEDFGPVRIGGELNAGFGWAELEPVKDGAALGRRIVKSSRPALSPPVALCFQPAIARLRRRPRIKNPARSKLIVSFQSSLLTSVHPRLLPNRVDSPWAGNRYSQPVVSYGLFPVEDIVHRDVLGKRVHGPPLLVADL